MAEKPRESNSIVPTEGYTAVLHKGDYVIPRQVADEMKRRLPDNGGINAPTTGVCRDLAVKLNVDVSDALTGLKALRREADAAVRSLVASFTAANDRTLSDYSTRELTDELTRRMGVTEYYLPPEYGVNVDFGGGPMLITGPCRILINVD